MEEQTLTGKLAQDENQDNLFSLHDIVQMVLTNWYWFLISMAICLGAAYYYIAKTPKIYVRTATILVKDTRKGGDIDVTAFSDLSGFQSRRSVDNEVYILQSRRLMTEVVRKLRLTTNYSVRDGLRRKDLYGQAPVDITFIDDSDNQRLSMQVVPRSDEKAALTGFRDGIVGDTEANRTIEVQYGDTVSTPIGRLVVNKTYYMSPSYYGTNIAVTKSPLSATTSAYRGAVRCEVANKLASVVTISMSNTVPRRAEDVINTLISEYNEDAIDDKRRVSITTADFIKSRLEIIGRELGAVDENIENFKKNNRMYDLSSEAVRSISESSKYKTEGLSVENQINVAEFIRSYLLDAATAGELIPAMASVESPEIATQIAAYNEAVLRREKLRANSSESNPVIRELDNSLAALRRAIVSSLDSFVSTLEIRRDALRKEEELANRRIATVPSQEKEILGITRQQKIKEELFLYLLNKQEENQLNFAVAESNARLRQLTARVAAQVVHSARGAAGRPGHSVRADLSAEHARHLHPRPQGPRGAAERSVSGRDSDARRQILGSGDRSRDGPRRRVGGLPHPAFQRRVHERDGPGAEDHPADLVESACGQDLHFAEPGRHDGHGRQEGGAHRPRPAPPCAVEPARPPEQ